MNQARWASATDPMMTSADAGHQPEVARATVRIEPNRYGRTFTVMPSVAARLASTAPPAMPP